MSNRSKYLNNLLTKLIDPIRKYILNGTCTSSTRQLRSTDFVNSYVFDSWCTNYSKENLDLIMKTILYEISYRGIKRCNDVRIIHLLNMWEEVCRARCHGNFYNGLYGPGWIDADPSYSSFNTCRWVYAESDIEQIMIDLDNNDPKWCANLLNNCMTTKSSKRRQRKNTQKKMIQIKNEVVQSIPFISVSVLDMVVRYVV
jgi:hypothetical protein